MLLKSLAIAFSTYSILPMPQFEWTKENMQYAICFFPAVGLLCGAALAAWNWLCGLLHISSLLFAAVASCLPVIISGGIHLDGYMDTIDALCSHQPQEKKLEIMHDTHCGAFAVIYCCVYFVLCLGMYDALYTQGQIYAVCPLFICSRALSALCAVTLPSARREGMLCAFTSALQRRTALLCISLTIAAGSILLLWLCPLSAAISLMLCLLTLLWYRWLALKQFGGVSGDTSGFFLQVCELAALAGYAAGGIISSITGLTTGGISV